MRHKIIWKLLAFSAVVLGGTVWCLFARSEQEEQYTVLIEELNGTALVERSDMQISAYEGMKLKNGDSISVTSGQDITLGMKGISFAVLENGVNLKLYTTKEKVDNSAWFLLEEGNVLFLSNGRTAAGSYVRLPDVRVEAGGFYVDAGTSAFYVAVENRGGIKETALSVWNGTVVAVPLENGKKERITAGMTARFRFDETGASVRGQKVFSLGEFSDRTLAWLLKTDEAQKIFCVSREELAEELLERAGTVATGNTNGVVTVTPAPSLRPEPTQIPAPTPTGSVTQKPEPTEIPAMPPEEPSVGLNATLVPSAGGEEVTTPAQAEATPVPTGTVETGTGAEITPEPAPAERTEPDAAPVPSELETIFSKLLKQTPEVNMEDDTVTYYEFAIGMLTAAEQGVMLSGQTPENLLTAFGLRLMLGGIDINKIDINAPIPRKDAALFLWYGAQTIGFVSAQTEQPPATAYVTDISDCTAAEQKAAGYLYASGYENGYQVEGQKFRPFEALSKEESAAWQQLSARLWQP